MTAEAARAGARAGPVAGLVFAATTMSYAEGDGLLPGSRQVGELHALCLDERVLLARERRMTVVSAWRRAATLAP